MHNVRLANQQDEIVKSIKQITSKRHKTQDDADEIDRLEWYGGLYYTEDLGLHVPTWNILRCFEEAGKTTREGKSVVRSVVMTHVAATLSFPGQSKDIDDLWADERYRWSTMVGVQRNKTSRMRPIFREWATQCEVELITDTLDRDSFERIVARAGLVEGVGDARKLGYGRFEGKVIDV
jgi:hypothetical protein